MVLRENLSSLNRVAFEQIEETANIIFTGAGIFSKRTFVVFAAEFFYFELLLVHFFEWGETFAIFIAFIDLIFWY